MDIVGIGSVQFRQLIWNCLQQNTWCPGCLIKARLSPVPRWQREPVKFSAISTWVASLTSGLGFYVKCISAPESLKGKNYNMIVWLYLSWIQCCVGRESPNCIPVLHVPKLSWVNNMHQMLNGDFSTMSSIVAWCHWSMFDLQYEWFNVQSWI